MKRIKFIIKNSVLFALIFFGPICSRSYSQPPEQLPADVAQSMGRYYALQGKRDYVPMYRDLSSPRFQASDSFKNFKTSMDQIMDKCGPAEGRELTYVLSDAYHQDQDFVFYRMQFDVKRQKCQTIERVVVMRRKRIWEVDGYAIAEEQQALFAQGNLYNFEQADEKTSMSGLEDLHQIEGLKDSRTEYLKKEWKQTADEYRDKYFEYLKTASEGNFQQAKSMMEENPYLPHMSVIDDAVAGAVSRETARTFFSAVRSVEEDENVDKGVSLFKKVLELDPSYVETYIYLAPLQAMALKDIDLGIKTADQGLQYHPDEVRLMMLLAGFYGSSGNIEKADQYLEKGKAINPFLFGFDVEPDEDGMVRTRYPNGQVAFEIEIVDEQPNGAYRVFYDDGALMSKGQYVNGEPEGTIEVYSQKGQLLKRLVYQRGKEMEAQHFDENGKVVYEKGVVHDNTKMKEGIVREEYGNGRWGEIAYENGERNGLSKTFFADGSIMTEQDYKNGKRHGHYRIYHENGQLYAEGDYVDDKADGTFEFYYEDGTLQKKVVYESGRFLDGNGEYYQGIYTDYYQDGNVQRETEYKDGLMEGRYRLYYENGQLSLEGLMKNEHLVVATEYDEDGNRIER